jgi:hypothetical protein
VAIEWTQTAFRRVTVFALFNGLWLGVLSWLVLGLWFEWFSFWQCLLGAIIVSWPVAIVRVGRAIEVDKEILEEMRMEDELAASEEVRSVLAAIDEVEDEEGAEGLHQIKQLVVDAVVVDADKTISSIKDDGLSARTLTCLLISNVLSVELTSGKHHTYRGVLSANGDRLLRLWDYAVEQQKQSGYYDEEEAKNDLKWIRDEIKTVG